MKKDFLIKFSVLPLIIGVFTAIAAITFFCVHVDIFSFVDEGTVLAKHEQYADTFESADSVETAADGEMLGTVKAKESFPIVVNAPYYKLDDVLSYEKSGEFGKSGIVYLETDNRVLKTIENSISFRAEGCFDKHDYVLVSAKNFGSLEALKAYSPDINKCVVIYAQNAGKIGLKNNYRALVFEEVQL